MQNDSQRLTLAGKKAFVVGGTSGIGSHVAKFLLQNGCAVTVTGRNAPECTSMDFLPYNFQSDGIEIFSSSDYFRILSDCDILCVCYGPFVYKPLALTELEDWITVSLADYALPGYLTSTAIRFMKNRKWGRILLFGGTRTDSIRAYRSNAAYAGAKTGISVLVKSAAAEVSESGVTCNAILPGFVTCPPPGAECIPAESVAEKALFLINSPDLNGVLLTVDNGWNK